MFGGHLLLLLTCAELAVVVPIANFLKKGNRIELVEGAIKTHIFQFIYVFVTVFVNLLNNFLRHSLHGIVARAFGFGGLP
jgi:uncharacterized membrane protein required for colicin V production